LVRARHEDVEYRNIRLKIETYKRLENCLLYFMQREADPSITLDRAVNLLIDEFKAQPTVTKLPADEEGFAEAFKKNVKRQLKKQEL
jgi:hypothetical protein